MEKKLSSLLQYQYWGKHCSAAGGVFHQDTECFSLLGRWCWLECRCSDAYLLKVLIFCPPFQSIQLMSLLYVTKWFFFYMWRKCPTLFLTEDCTSRTCFNWEWTCTVITVLPCFFFLYSYFYSFAVCSVCIFIYRKRANAVSPHDTHVIITHVIYH